MNRRLIFKDKNAETKLGAICVNQFWLLRALRKGDPARQIPYELEYQSDGMDDDVHLIFVKDPIAECTYVIVSGKDMEAACERISRKIETVSDKELFAAWQQADNDTNRILAILHLGVGAPFYYNEPFAEQFRIGLTNPDPLIREATLAAIGYRGWPEFDREIEHLSVTDDCERCRNRARHMMNIAESEKHRHDHPA